MRISDQFPSNYLRAVDVEGDLTLIMTNVEPEKIGEDMKQVLYFEGKEKGMVLNKTNAGAIAQIYGDETDDWRGEAITLFSAMVSFQGKTVPAIRVKAPSKKKAAAAQAGGARRPPQVSGGGAPPIDDEIPFAPEWRG